MSVIASWLQCCGVVVYSKSIFGHWTLAGQRRLPWSSSRQRGQDSGGNPLQGVPAPVVSSKENMAKNIKKRMPNFYFKVSIWVKSDQGPSPGSLEWLLSEAEARRGWLLVCFQLESLLFANLRLQGGLE